jgi:hypothetical protein
VNSDNFRKTLSALAETKNQEKEVKYEKSTFIINGCGNGNDFRLYRHR